MGCIPRSPSPAEDVPTNYSNDQSTATSFAGADGSEDVLREVQDLRVSHLLPEANSGCPLTTLQARLAQLERSLNTQAESSDAKMRVKSEQVRTIKREREEGENGRSGKRRRGMPAEVEHIDLTDD